MEPTCDIESWEEPECEARLVPSSFTRHIHVVFIGTCTYTCTQNYIRKQIQVIEGDTSLDESERTRRKQVSLPVHVHVGLVCYITLLPTRFGTLCGYCRALSISLKVHIFCTWKFNNLGESHPVPALALPLMQGQIPDLVKGLYNYWCAYTLSYLGPLLLKPCPQIASFK